VQCNTLILQTSRQHYERKDKITVGLYSLLNSVQAVSYYEMPFVVISHGSVRRPLLTTDIYL
jgi:hypothetical protein